MIELEKLIAKRNEQRKQVLSLLEEAILSGKKMWEYQVEEEALLLACGSDERGDDHDCARVQDLLNNVTSLREDLLKLRKESDSLMKQFVKQLTDEMEQQVVLKRRSLVFVSFI